MFFRAQNGGVARAAATCALAAALIAVPAGPALAGGASGFPEHPGGGKGKDGGKGSTKPDKKAKPGKARLAKNGDAIPPSKAPKPVVKAIEAANEINDKPYRHGGGHGKFKDKGYDCSGAISYALRGGKLLKSPLDSSGFMKYGKGGKGKWISIYANKGHAYVIIAGLRFDTSSAGAARNQNGPRWYKEKASKKGYEVRHPKGV
jgi:hypothetical protein